MSAKDLLAMIADEGAEYVDIALLTLAANFST